MHSEKVERIPKKYWNIFVTIVIFTFILIFIIQAVGNIKEKREEKRIAKREAEARSLASSNESSPTVSVLPDEYEEEITLKRGQPPIKVKVPIGYKVNMSGKGKKYYLQAEGAEKALVGGGLPSYRHSDHSSFFVVSFPEEENEEDEEIKITFYFQKMNLKRVQ